MISKSRALELGIPAEWLDAGFLERNDEGTVVTQWCDDCGAVIAVHPDGRWRLKITAIRCKVCAQKLIDKGYDAFEAYCVE